MNFNHFQMKLNALAQPQTSDKGLVQQLLWTVFTVSLSYFLCMEEF